MQGGQQAEGDWPTFSSARWVRSNGHYGHGCACLRVVVEAAGKPEQRVQRILSAQSRPLQTCRRDLAPTEPSRH